MVTELDPPTSRATLLAYAAPSFGIQAIWGTIAAYVPVSLERAGASPAQVGVILALMPAMAVIAQPIASARSDRVAWPLGRRRPFVAAGVAVATVGLLLLAAGGGIVTQALGLVIVSLGLYSALGPYRALMADAFPARDHLTAAALMTAGRALGLMSVVGFAAVTSVVQSPLPFLLCAVVLVAASAWTIAAVRERRRVTTAPVRTSAWRIARADPRIRNLFVAQFLWWLGLHGPMQFLSLFLVHDLGTSAASAPAETARLLMIAAAVGVLLAMPLGRIARRFGSVTTLAIGLAITAAGLGGAWWVHTLAATRIVVILFGVGYTCVQIVPYTLLASRQPEERAGTLAGAFQLLITVPQIVATTMLGAVAEWMGSYRVVMPLSAACVMASIVVVTRVRGE
jgi:maltose/moltooligosaccharide transporter